MSKPLRNKIAVVTGGTKGLGYIISSELAVLGAQVLIIYKNDHTTYSDGDILDLSILEL